MRWNDLRALGLIAAGVVAISGHVGLGLSLLGPLALLPTVALVVAVVCLVLLLPGADGLGPGLVLVAAALAVTLPAWLLAGDHEYASDKVYALLTLVLPLLVVVTYCVRQVADVRWFLNGLFALAAFGVVVAFIDLVSGVDIGLRGSDNAGYLNPIAAGRLAGSVVLWILFARVRVLPRAVQAGLLLASGAVILGAASRGPLLSLIVAVGVTALAARALRGKLAVAAVVVGLALAGGVGNSVLQESGDRILAGGDEGGSQSRTFLWGQAVDAMTIWPEGVGWGQFSSEGVVGAAGEYPHNLFLEIGVEAGVLAAVVLALLAAVTLRRLWLSAETVGPEYLAILVFWLFSAMFSSDVNGNRVPIVLLIALFAGLRAEQRAAAADQAGVIIPGGGSTPVTVAAPAGTPSVDSTPETTSSQVVEVQAHD